MHLDAATIWMVIWFTLLITIAALFLAPPTFISGLFDGDNKRRKKAERDRTGNGA